MKINYNKKDLALELSAKMGFSILYSEKILNDFLKCLINQIINSELKLKNFGTFKKIKKNERIGRNPKTSETYIINSRQTLKFLPSNKFKLFLNDN